MSALALAALLWLGQQLPKPPDREPYEVVIVDGETAVDMTYVPERDQHKLAAPKSWCLTARRSEPLLRDARRIAGGEDLLLGLTLPKLPAGRIRVVRQESACEAAARVFDRNWFGGGNASIDTHTTFAPVLVIEVGSIYLVGLRREPGEPFVVVALDRQMNEVGSFGEGL
ncbi:MAG: hypothetical protein U0Q55_10265 [Vicinamibacterales bacterium]